MGRRNGGGRGYGPSRRGPFRQDTRKASPPLAPATHKVTLNKYKTFFLSNVGRVQPLMAMVKEELVLWGATLSELIT